MPKKPRKNPPRESLPKRALDRRVAELLGKKISDISDITEAFIHEIVGALVDGDEVRLDGLGIISVMCAEMSGKPVVLTNLARRDGTRDKATIEVHRKYYVKVRKSARLKEALWARHGRLTTRRTPDGEVRRRRKRGR